MAYYSIDTPLNTQQIRSSVVFLPLSLITLFCFSLLLINSHHALSTSSAKSSTDSSEPQSSIPKVEPKQPAKLPAITAQDMPVTDQNSSDSTATQSSDFSVNSLQSAEPNQASNQNASDNTDKAIHTLPMRLPKF